MSKGKSFFGKSSAKPPPVSEEISAFLGKETVFEGKMTFQGVFRLEGKFEGEIFESGTLVIGDSAAVKGKIEVYSAIINGRVDGEIYARAKVEIHSTGRLYGNLVTPALIINEGGIFEGYCKMEKDHEETGDLQLLARKEDHSLSA